MLVMILESVPSVLRGELSRWLTPVGKGVHVGQVTALVRDQLWDLAVSKARNGRVIQIWSRRSEPGYDLRVHGLAASFFVDTEGIPMIAVQDAAWREATERFRIPVRGSALETDPEDLEAPNGSKPQ